MLLLNKEQEIEKIFDEWNNVYPTALQLIKNQHKEQFNILKKHYLGELKKILIYCNLNHPAESKHLTHNQFEEFKYKPLNIGERLTFIENSNHDRNVLMQLNELFIEMRKKYAVAKLKVQKQKNLG